MGGQRSNKSAHVLPACTLSSPKTWDVCYRGVINVTQLIDIHIAMVLLVDVFIVMLLTFCATESCGDITNVLPCLYRQNVLLF